MALQLPARAHWPLDAEASLQNIVSEKSLEKVLKAKTTTPLYMFTRESFRSLLAQGNFFCGSLLK